MPGIGHGHSSIDGVVHCFSGLQWILLIAVALSFDALGQTVPPRGCAVDKFEITGWDGGSTKPSPQLTMIWLGIANSSAQVQGLTCTSTARGDGTQIKCTDKLCVATYKVQPIGSVQLSTLNVHLEGGKVGSDSGEYWTLASLGPLGNGGNTATNVQEAYWSYPITNCEKEYLCQPPAFESQLWMPLINNVKYANWNLQVAIKITKFPWKTCTQSEIQQALADALLVEWRDVEVISGPVVTGDANLPTSTLVLNIRLWIYTDFPVSTNPARPISAEHQKQWHLAGKMAHDVVKRRLTMCTCVSIE